MTLPHTRLVNVWFPEHPRAECARGSLPLADNGSVVLTFTCVNGLHDVRSGGAPFERPRSAVKS